MDAKLKSFAIQLLRRGTFRWEPRYTAKNNARVGQFKVNGKGREVWHYKCSLCSGVFVDKETVVDHVHPVVDPILGFQGFDIYIERMYCGIEGFQVLCESCHDSKTKTENTTRKIVRQAKPKVNKKKIVP